MAYPVNADGSIGAGRVFADVTADAKAKLPGLPDGMKIDVAGNLWATAPGGIHIYTPAGELLGTIRTSVPTANLAWGDDGSTLYLTSNTAVWRVKTKAKGKIRGVTAEGRVQGAGHQASEPCPLDPVLVLSFRPVNVRRVAEEHLGRLHHGL